LRAKPASSGKVLSCSTHNKKPGAKPGWSEPLSGAGNGARTRDIKLGKLALYQLSYARISKSVTVPSIAVKTFEGIFPAADRFVPNRAASVSPTKMKEARQNEWS
jgi:hypothetical protein